MPAKLKLLLALAGSCLAAGCAAPALPTYEYDALAVEVTAVADVDLYAIANAWWIAYGAPQPGFYPDGSAVVGSYDDIDFSYFVTCTPGSCGSSTTSANIMYAAAGETGVANESGDAFETITHDGTWALAGGGDRSGALAGTVTFADDAAILDISYAFNGTATYAIAIDGSGNPVTGTIALELDASEAAGSGAIPFSAKAAVALAGSAAAIVLDGSRDYTADLEEHYVTASGSGASGSGASASGD